MHVTEIDVPVDLFGITVRPCDLVHADRHGAVVIPADMTDRLAAGIRKTVETERIVLEPARSADFDFDAFEDAWKRFEAART